MPHRTTSALRTRFNTLTQTQFEFLKLNLDQFPTLNNMNPSTKELKKLSAEIRIRGLHSDTEMTAFILEQFPQSKHVTPRKSIKIPSPPSSPPTSNKNTPIKFSAPPTIPLLPPVDPSTPEPFFPPAKEPSTPPNNRNTFVDFDSPIHNIHPAPKPAPVTPTLLRTGVRTLLKTPGGGGDRTPIRTPMRMIAPIGTPIMPFTPMNNQYTPRALRTPIMPTTPGSPFSARSDITPIRFDPTSLTPIRMQQPNARLEKPLSALEQEELSRFLRKRDKLAREFFLKARTKAFNDIIPLETEVSLTGRLTTTAGRCCYPSKSNPICRIQLSKKLITNINRLHSTLLHEMCHAAVFFSKMPLLPSHGSSFKHWGSIATSAFPDFPVSTFHSYLSGGGGGYETVEKKERPLTPFNKFVKEQFAETRQKLEESKLPGTPAITNKEILAEIGSIWKEKQRENAGDTGDDSKNCRVEISHQAFVIESEDLTEETCHNEHRKVHVRLPSIDELRFLSTPLRRQDNKIPVKSSVAVDDSFISTTPIRRPAAATGFAAKALAMHNQMNELGSLLSGIDI